MTNQNIHHYEEMEVVHTTFSNFTPFNEFEGLLSDTIEIMKNTPVKTWVIDLTDVVILGKLHLNFFIDSCLPRVKHLNVHDVKIIKSKFNFDTSFERNLKRALTSMHFNFQYSYGIHELSKVHR